MKITAGMSEGFAARVLRLRADFIATFPPRIERLREMCAGLEGHLADAAPLRRVRSEVHQLRGAAGMYQLETLHCVARATEGSLDELLERIAGGPIRGAEVTAALTPLLEILARDDH